VWLIVLRRRMKRVITAISIMATMTLLAVSLGLTAAGSNIEPGFWSVGDVASFLGITEATVRYWSYCGSGPPVYKIGRYLKFKPIEVRAWADAQLRHQYVQVEDPEPPPATVKRTPSIKRERSTSTEPAQKRSRRR
jgi:hypothetical protein